MENASKALLMAGAVLIAILIIGLLLFMFNQISDFKKSGNEIEKNSQIVAFNTDFERYTYEEIKGVDIISIINKVVDFNKKSDNGGTTNSVDYSIKMSIMVSNLNKFKQDYIVNTDGIFSNIDSKENGSITINTSYNKFTDIIKDYTDLENKYSLSVMGNLSSRYNDLKDLTGNNYEKKLKEILGNRYNQNLYPSKEQIKNYKDYTEFKSSTFKVKKDSVYKNGQIKDLFFEYVK